MEGALVARSVIDAVVQLIVATGLDRKAALAAAGLTDDTMADPDALLPERAERQLWEYVVTRNANRGLGIVAGQNVSRGTYHSLEYVLRTEPTLGDAVRSLMKFGRLIRNTDLYEVAEDEEGLHLRLCRAYDPTDLSQSIAIEASVMTLVSAGRDATGADWVPRMVRFRHPAPIDTSIYAPLGPCVLFGQPRVELVLHRKDASRPMIEADSVLHALVTECAGRRLEGIPTSQTCVSAVRRVLLDWLPEREPGLAAVAETLGIGPRVLQRRLQQEGTNFRALVESAREEIAKQYLAETNMSAIDVAMLLDYSDAPSFYRAFRRWTGVSPGEFRRRLRSPAHASA